jgi:hypothetical protein
MLDFAELFHRIHGEAFAVSPEGQAAMDAAKARYDAAGVLAEQIVAEGEAMKARPTNTR